ncbi:MAG: hypothetical protein WAL70_10165 [Aeromicrobium sp.]
MNLKLERSGPWIGVTGLFVMLWLVFTSVFLYAPWWGFVLHLVVLATFVPLLKSWARTQPARCIWIPVYAFLAWCAINALGVLVLGWDVR